MTILIAIGKGILWLMGGIGISYITVSAYNFFSNELDEYGNGLILVLLGTFILYFIGSVIWLFFG